MQYIFIWQETVLKIKKVLGEAYARANINFWFVLRTDRAVFQASCVQLLSVS